MGFCPRLFYPDGNGIMLSQMKTNDSDNLIISRPRGPAMFDLVSDFAPAGDQPTAISDLVDGINSGERDQVLLGVKIGRAHV